MSPDPITRALAEGLRLLLGEDHRQMFQHMYQRDDDEVVWDRIHPSLGGLRRAQDALDLYDRWVGEE